MEAKPSLAAQLAYAKGRPLVWWQNLLTRRVQIILDILVLLLAFWLAYAFRFDFAISEEWQQVAAVQCLVIVLLQFAALNRFGGHNFIWRYTSLAHLSVFLYAMAVSFGLCVALRLTLPASLSMGRMPISVAVLDSLLAFGGLLGVRIFRRTLYEAYEKQKRAKAKGNVSGKTQSVLLIGAGQAGFSVLREIERQGGLGLNVKGFVDDDRAKQNMQVSHGLKVLGTTDDLPALVQDLEIDHVIVTIAQAGSHDFQRILSICRDIPVRVRTIPSWAEIIQGRVSVGHIRDVQIEDLLGRNTVELDTDSMSGLLASRVVMVTGAGGSIGSELARQVAQFNPSRLLLVERAEPSLFTIERELCQSFSADKTVPLIADVGDTARMRHIMEQYRPQVILHAAAHKHVPLMEQNPCEAVKNNAFATRSLGTLAGECGAEVFVLISTDKAVRPTSVMGASKRLAELLIQDLNRHYAATRYVAVRFGNVIGSAGSVVPIFQAQIKRGGPVTLTDKRMTRYFMTIPEASQLVLQAGAMPGQGGEVYVLRMGEPVKIVELAENLITLSGFRPYDEIEIVETGRRPGEKLFEELVIDEEIAETLHPKILISRIAGIPETYLFSELERLKEAAHRSDSNAVRGILSALIAEASIENSAPRPATSGSALTQAANSSAI